MRGRESTSQKNSPSVGPDAVVAIVRLLARQAARGFVVQASAPDSPKPASRHRVKLKSHKS